MIRAALEDSTDACSAREGTLLNPYRAGFGNSDFNIQLQSIVYAAAFFQATLDKSWLDNSAVYMQGRGEEPGLTPPESVQDGYEFVSFEALTGLTYSAIRPLDFDASDLSGENAWVGASIIDQMGALQHQVDVSCPFQFVNNPDDLMRNCGMVREDAEEFICGYLETTRVEAYNVSRDTARLLLFQCSLYDWDTESSTAHVALNGPVVGYFEASNNLDRLIEMTRFQMELNMVYNGL
jgi:hypothetical protein